MARIEIDTNADSLEELEEALGMIRAAIDRRRGSPAKPDEQPSAQDLVKEASINTPFFKITFEAEDDLQGPTVNELLENEAITEDELTDLFKHAPAEPKKKSEKPKENEDAFIEIVELDDDED